MHHLYFRIAGCWGIFLCVMASAAYGWQYPTMLTVFLATGAAVLLSRWHRLDDIVYFSVAFVVAPLGELIAIQNGAWRYSGEGTGIPIWLPFGWGICAVGLRRLSVAVVELVRAIREPRASLAG